jgi:hypothetical protein
LIENHQAGTDFPFRLFAISAGDYTDLQKADTPINTIFASGDVCNIRWFFLGKSFLIGFNTPVTEI